MSDAQQTGPDLHAIFGIDGEAATAEHTVARVEEIGEGLDLDSLEEAHEVALDPATVELDHLDLGVFQVDMTAANLVNTTVAKRYQAVPVAFADKRTLLVAMADPSNVLAVDDIAIMTGYEIRVAVAPPDDIATLVSRLDRLEDVVGDSVGLAEELEEEEGGEVVALHETSEDAPV